MIGLTGVFTNTLFLVVTILASIRHTYVTATTTNTTTTTTTITSSSYNNSDDAMRLLRDVIDPYDARLRPVFNQSKSVEIFVTYHLVNLKEIDEVNQNIIINIWVNFTWYDEFRTWNPKDYGGNDVIHPKPNDIWRPKTTITNAASERDVFKDYDSPLFIYPSGETRWYTGGLYDFICGMDLTYFPFDQQTCDAIVVAANLGHEIIFNPTPTILLRDFVINGEWNVISTKVEFISNPVTLSEKEELVFLILTVAFKRRPTYYVIHVLAPAMSLSFLSMLAFVVPKDSGERASFAITVLLSLTVYMGTVSSVLPANSDTFPLISVYIFSLLCLSMVSVLIIVIQLRTLKLPPIDEEKEEENKKEKEEVEKEEDAKRQPDNCQVTGNDIDNEAHTKNISRNANLSTKSNYLGKKQDTTFVSDSNSKSGKFIKVAPLQDPFNKDIHQGCDDESESSNDKSTIQTDSCYYYSNTDIDMNSSNRSVGGKERAWKNASLLLKRMRVVFWEHDDAILVVLFTILWVIFTLVFVASMASHF